MAENLIETVRLLVVTRESALLGPLWSVAEEKSWQIEAAGNPWDAIERVQSGVPPHLLLLDVPRGDGDCLHLLRWLRRLRPDIPVIVTCFPEDAGRKKEATRMGAQEVLIRPFDEEGLESAIERHLLRPEKDLEVSSEDIEQVGPESFFVSASPITQKLRAQAELLAEADVPVLILGEPGSGKDTVARLIHKLSVRSGFNFFKVNCADMPGEFLEAELFGSERNGSFGNDHAAQGKFERAEKGTVFLDQITEMPLSAQAKLMNVLQDKVLLQPRRDRAVPVDVRILAASSASIDRLLAERKIREDLYHRLSAFTMHIPPLRQRKAEIAVLLQHSMHRIARHYGLPAREFSPAVLEACQQHSWPGNLDELENFVKRYLVGGEGELSFGVFEATPSNGNGNRIPPASKLSNFDAEMSSRQSDRETPKSLRSFLNTLRCEAERNAIGTALQTTGWNRKAAARLLQVSYRTLLYKIEQYRMTAAESFPAPLPLPRSRFSQEEAKGEGKTR